MGVFSWQTADTKESIANIHTGQCRPVYLLQPNGKPPIYEPAYDGYGNFGEKDAYVWLAENNLPRDKVESLSEEELRRTGISLEMGKYFTDKKTGEKWTIFRDISSDIIGEHNFFNGSYSQIIPEIGKTPNDLVSQGRFEKKNIEDMITYPLKFSFSEDAVYENLPASRDCPYQGHFLPENKTIEDLKKSDETILVFDLEHNSQNSIGVISVTQDSKIQAHIYDLDDNPIVAKIWMEVEWELAEHDTYSQKIDEISHFVNNDERVGEIHKDELELYQENKNIPGF